MPQPTSDIGPSAEVSTVIGAIGLCLFFILSILAVYCLIVVKSRNSKRLFICTLLYCVLELPRYISLLIEQAYVNKASYIMHMFSSLFYFSAFCFVCCLLHDAVDMSRTTYAANSSISSLADKPLIQRLLFDERTLIIANVVLTVLVLMSSVICLTHPSLDHFFRYSDIYKIFTLYDALVNIFFAASLLYFGCRLRKKIIRFTAKYTVGWEGEALQLSRMRAAVRKLLLVMAVCLVSFLLRAVMLVLKLLVIEMGGEQIGAFPAYGILWWCLADFIPRSFPTLSFVWFFGKAPRYAATVTDTDGNVKSPLRATREEPRDLYIASMGSDDLEVSLMEEDYDQQRLRDSVTHLAAKFSLSHRFSLLGSEDLESGYFPDETSATAVSPEEERKVANETGTDVKESRSGRWPFSSESASLIATASDGPPSNQEAAGDVAPGRYSLDIASTAADKASDQSL